ncbi:MAG: hypothetical protein RLP44_08280 [Aggregatilineales bacterium]
MQRQMVFDEQLKKDVAKYFGFERVGAGQNHSIDNDGSLIRTVWVDYWWMAAITIWWSEPVILSCLSYRESDSNTYVRNGLIFAPHLEKSDDSIASFRVETTDLVEEAMKSVNILPRDGEFTSGQDYEHHFLIHTFVNNGSATISYSGASEDSSIVNLQRALFKACENFANQCNDEEVKHYVYRSLTRRFED